MVGFAIIFSLIGISSVLANSYGYKFNRVPGTNDCRLSLNLPGYPPAFPSSLDTRYSNKFTGDKNKRPSSGAYGSSYGSQGGSSSSSSSYGSGSSGGLGQQGHSGVQGHHTSSNVYDSNRRRPAGSSINSQTSKYDSASKDQYDQGSYGSDGYVPSKGYGSSSTSNEETGSGGLQGYQKFRPNDVVECRRNEYYSMRQRKCILQEGTDGNYNSWGDDRVSTSLGSGGQRQTGGGGYSETSSSQGYGGVDNKRPASADNYGTADKSTGESYGSYGSTVSATDSKGSYGSGNTKAGSVGSYGTDSEVNYGSSGSGTRFVTDSRESYGTNSGEKYGRPKDNQGTGSAGNYGTSDGTYSKTNSGSRVNYGTDTGKRYGSSEGSYGTGSRETYTTDSESDGQYGNPGSSNSGYGSDSKSYSQSGSGYDTKRVKAVEGTSTSQESYGSSAAGSYATDSGPTNYPSRPSTRPTGSGNGFSSSSSTNTNDRRNYGGYSGSSGGYNSRPSQEGQGSDRYDESSYSKAFTSTSSVASGGDAGVGVGSDAGQGGEWNSGTGSVFDYETEEGNKPSAGGYDEQFVQEAFQAHNSYRAKHGATPLVLDDELSESAQALAESFASGSAFGHSPEAMADKVGESLAVKSGRTTGSDAVDFWYKEMRNYDFDSPQLVLSPKSKANIHFTAILWNSTRKVGIGKARSPDGRTFVVANYFPPGNYPNKIKENVFPPNRAKARPSYK